MPATTEQLKQILEDAARRVANLPEWRRSDEVKRDLQALQEQKANREREPK